MRSRPVRLGLSLPNRGVLFGLTSVEALLEASALAEKSGAFESVWLGDSLIHKPRLESTVMLGAIAARTTKVRLGVMCMASFPVRHPLLLAIQWATLDRLSNGRTVLGVCIGGGHGPELKAFGVGRGERVARLEEGIELLRKLWCEEKVQHRGRFYVLEGYSIEPKPLQRPCPIWLAVSPERKVVGDAGVERVMRRVVTLADGYITVAVPRDEFLRRRELIEAIAAETGKDLSNFETSVHGTVNINENRRAAYEESKFYFDRYYGPGYPTEEMIRLWLAHGAPEECARHIQSWIDMGVTTPVLRFTSRDQLGQIDLFVEKVLPLLKLSNR